MRYFDYVVAENAEIPHVKVVFRSGHPEEKLVAEFFISDVCPVAECTFRAMELADDLECDHI